MTSEQIELPSNIEAEQLLLGKIMLENDRFFKIGSFLKSEHFSEPVHQRIYRAISEKIVDGRKVTAFTLKADFENDPDLAHLEGGKYLGSLMGMVTIPVNVTEHAKTIISLSKRRRIINMAQKAISEAVNFDADKDVEQIEGAVFNEINEIINDTFVSKFRTDRQVSEGIVESFKQPIECHSTGIPILDRSMLGGMYPRRLYTVAARMKTGKTMFAATVAYNLAQQGIKTAFITAEMDDDEIQRRILARMAGEFSSSFSNQDRDSLIFQEKIAEEACKLSGNLVYCYEPSITFDSLKQRLHYAVYNLGIKGFILDQWQLVTGKKRNESEASHLSDVAQWLAGFCKRENVFGFVLCQLNQEGNTLGSEGIKRAADQLYLLHKCEDYDAAYYMEMQLSRYTPTFDMGAENMPVMRMNFKGPFFEQI